MGSASRWTSPLAFFLTASALKVQENPPRAACDCLPWKTAFASHGADCSKWGEEGCKRYFMQLPDETFCLNVETHLSDPQQWCYVSSECQKDAVAPVWGASNNPHPANWKYCDGGARRLGDFKIKELVSWCKKNDLEIGFVVQFAYPALQHFTVPDVVEFWGLTMPEAMPMEQRLAAPIMPELREELQAHVNSSKTLFIGSRTGHPPYLVLEGKQAYWINFGSALLKKFLRGEDIWSEPSKLNSVRCVSGCPKTVAPWWSIANEKVQ
uniref:Uncharacterized protein n=1 Tax=Alexandrium catenella TaxID=2925 RepID=A0A7S1R1S8_ALECA